MLLTTTPHRLAREEIVFSKLVQNDFLTNKPSASMHSESKTCVAGRLNGHGGPDSEGFSLRTHDLTHGSSNYGPGGPDLARHAHLDLPRMPMPTQVSTAAHLTLHAGRQRFARWEKTISKRASQCLVPALRHMPAPPRLAASRRVHAPAPCWPAHPTGTTFPAHAHHRHLSIDPLTARGSLRLSNAERVGSAGLRSGAFPDCRCNGDLLLKRKLGKQTTQECREEMGKNAQNNSCIEPIESSLFLHYSLIPSFIIIIVLAFLEKRARRCCFDENFSLLSRRFGVLIPFDFVDLNGSYSNRWSVGFAFGVTADKVMFLFLDMYIPVTIPGWAKVFWVLLIAIEVGISSYPFFVCLSTRHRLTGAIFGFLYTATWLAITLLDIFLCSEIDVLGEHSEMFFLWPSILSYLFLLGRFVFIFVKEIRIRRGLASENEEISFMEGYQAKYVHRLFRKRPLHCQRETCQFAQSSPLPSFSSSLLKLSKNTEIYAN
ncbi:Stimulated by retinoic acid gene 6 protein-like [Varanus komodoensis]|nr:Stimulated by retinoic acid gene 6 protein-like [Varanus komodoensis]